MSDELKSVLEELKAGKRLPLYLLWGEEFLVRQGAEELLQRLLPGPSTDLSLVVLDGASPREIAQELATLPLFPGPKVVLVRDPEFLAPKKRREDALSRAREAWKTGRRKEGARRLLSLAARAGWSAADLDPKSSESPTPERWREELGVVLAEADLVFLGEVAAYCKEEGLSAPEGDAAALLALFERGLPAGHTLLIAATEVDSKSSLVKLAREQGRLLERKVAAKLKDLDLGDLAASVLAPYRQRISGRAKELLKDRCGGNMRLLASELEKLAQYARGRDIEEADVELLVGRAREEEYLELSNALQKRDLSAALRYLRDALAQEAAPLLILGSVVSIVRGLVVAGEQLKSLPGGRPPRSFEEFRSRHYPSLEAEAKASGARPPQPYAIFMSMQAAARYSRGELLSSLAACAEADLALKSGGGRLVLERLLWTVCGNAPA